MKKIFLVVVGKNKTDALVKEELEYLKRIKSFKLLILELRLLASKEKNDLQVLEKIKSLCDKNQPTILLLDERGQQYSSESFSNYFFNLLESSPGPLIFVIGGADGHGDLIKQSTPHHFSLSKFTLPHRFARLILIEQLYRAETIKRSHPYHK